VWKSRVGEREEMGENDHRCQISRGRGHQELPNVAPHAPPKRHGGYPFEPTSFKKIIFTKYNLQ